MTVLCILRIRSHPPSVHPLRVRSTLERDEAAAVKRSFQWRRGCAGFGGAATARPGDGGHQPGELSITPHRDMISVQISLVFTKSFLVVACEICRLDKGGSKACCLSSPPPPLFAYLHPTKGDHDVRETEGEQRLSIYETQKRNVESGLAHILRDS